MSQTTPCRTCGALLAPDQRYCVGCGTRVAAPRLDFAAEAERAEAAARNGSAPGFAVAATNGAGSAGGAQTAAPGAAGAAAGTAVPGAAAARPSRLDGIGGPMGAAAIALVALGVGFLLGQTRAVTPPAQRAPVVKIENATPSGGDATRADGDAGAGATGDAGATGGDAGSASEATTPAAGAAETETDG